MHAYVGSRTTRGRNARGQGISVFDAQASGHLERIQLVTQGPANPSYLAVSHTGTTLYTVHGDGQEVSAFAVASDATLMLLNTVDLAGRNPVHLALDGTGRWLVVTVHLAGKVVALPVLGDGRLGQAVRSSISTFGVPGPHRVEQPFAKPHCNQFAPSGHFIVVPDKGVDRVFSFRFERGQLYPAQPAYVQAREGAGPRSAVFHPSGHRVYVVNELDSTVTTYLFDCTSGAMSPHARHSTLPASFTGNSRAAAIQINRAGTHLYASNRGHDSIALFEVDDVGDLRFCETVSSGGRTPRFFTLSPDESLLYALNEDSDNIVVVAVHAESGRLRLTGQVTHCASPVCMVFRPCAPNARGT